MTKHTASAQDQEEPQRPSRSSPQAKMALIKKENKKPAKKAGRPKMPKPPTMTISDPLLLNSPSTNGNVDPRIAERAYELWEHRGGHHGQDLEDWVAAEREVRSEEECCS
jgi:hypothetical protein